MRLLKWMAQYAWLTLRHKFFVFIAGVRVGAPLWRLIVHDWTKFTMAELPHYARQFFGDQGDPEGFMRAWLHHQNSHSHHWEYWIPRTMHNRSEKGFLSFEPLDMPWAAILEMMSDWIGATRAYQGKWPWEMQRWSWLEDHLEEIEANLSLTTRGRLYSVLWELEARGVIPKFRPSKNDLDLPPMEGLELDPREIEEHNVEECQEEECLFCGAKVCPHGEPLHFHHDGCPACCAFDDEGDG